MSLSMSLGERRGGAVAPPQSQDWTFGAFAMSPQSLRWFAESNENKRDAMLLTRREAIADLGGGIVTLIAPAAFAQTTYPRRNIKMIVPYPAGGTTDYLGRMVADQIKTRLKATVIVENKPGAATSLGA